MRVFQVEFKTWPDPVNSDGLILGFEEIGGLTGGPNLLIVSF
jgi:hypothetical protein